MRKFCHFCLFSMMGAGVITAQQINSGESEDTDKDVVTLSAFEVGSTQGGGYLSHHATSGFRSRKELLDIPQAITVVPRDLIDDIGQFRNEVDIVKYAAAGISSEHKGNQPHMRGFRSNVILEDGVWDNTFNNGDSIIADSYEVLRGPAAVLYGGRPTLAGIITRSTKKPSMTPGYMVRGILGSENFNRVEVDLKGPITDSLFGSSGKLSYRLVAALQRDKGFPTGNKDDRELLFPALQLEFPNTTFRVQGEISEQRTAGVPQGFFTQDLKNLYIGSDKGRNQLWKEDWSEATFSRQKVRFNVEHSFNDSWDAQLMVYRNVYDRKDFDIRPGGNPNFTTRTWNQNYFHNFTDAELTVFSLDLIGKYELFGLSNESFVGVYADRNSSRSGRRVFAMTPISIDNPILNRERPPLPEDVNVPYWGKAVGDTGHISYSHTANFFEKKLALVAGLGRNYVQNQNFDFPVGDITREQTVRETTHRYGIVYRPMRSLSFFVNNSSTFLPQTNRDYLGNYLASTEGDVVDIGVKFNTDNERVVGSVTYFDLTASNIRVTDFDHPGFWLAAGEQNNKGYEIELAVKPTKNSQIIATYYEGDIKDTQSGIRLNNSVNQTYSLIAKYDFDSGLTVGTTMYHQGFRLQSGTTGWPAWTVWNAFVNYRVNKQLSLALNIENLEDKLYSPGGFNVTAYSNIGAPRNAKLTATYRF